MGYADGQTLIKALVLACDNFDQANVFETDWRPLNTGASDHYAILRPGPFALEWITMTNYVVHWTTVIEVWQQYVDETTTQAALYARVADLMSGILPYPKLKDATGAIQKNATIQGAADPVGKWKAGDGGPAWLTWDMRVGWNEEVQVTYGE